MKISILHENGSESGCQQSFDLKGVVRLGRHPDNDFVFNEAAHRTVSSFHAEIRREGGKAIIVDNGSTNGVLLNGRRVEKSSLHPGDIIELGKDGPSFRIDQVDSVAPDEPIAEKQVEHVAPVQQPTKEKKYGTRTVGMIVQRALAEAGLLKPRGTSKTTDYFEAIVEKRVKLNSSRTMRIVLAVLIAIVLAGAGFAYYIYRNRSVNVYQTTEVNYGELRGGEIAAANRFAIFMLAGQSKSAEQASQLPSGFCTAFAVADGILATNAHCLKLGREEYTNLIMIMNGAPQNRYSVIRMAIHPGYQAGQISPDVGLLRIRGHLPKLVTIADVVELERLAPGVPMFLYGFPGRLNRIDAPEATFVKGDIGRVTTFEQRLGNFGQNTLLQHSAYSSSGTSGSPIFNTAGRVIGINAGGYTEDGKPLSGYNFAMRIDLINTLLPAIRMP